MIRPLIYCFACLVALGLAVTLHPLFEVVSDFLIGTIIDHNPLSVQFFQLRWSYLCVHVSPEWDQKDGELMRRLRLGAPEIKEKSKVITTYLKNLTRKEGCLKFKVDLIPFWASTLIVHFLILDSLGVSIVVIVFPPLYVI